MHIQTDRAFIPSNTPCVRYLQVVIAAPAAAPNPNGGGTPARTPADVALVLDRSGSMDGKKIEMARAAVAHAIRLLKPSDRMGIACYDEQITTVIDGTAATKEAKTLALKRLAEIEARGSTDLAGGWQRGAELVPTREDGGDAIRKVLLLTDGLANHGIVDHGELVAMARRLRAEGVATSTFGVGADFDEDLLSRIAAEGGGHFYFIERPAQIPDFFASELGETLEVVARDAVFELTCDPGVEAAVLNAFPIAKHDNRLRVELGHLVADQEIALVIAVAFKGSAPLGAGLGVQCRVSDKTGALYREPIDVTWQAVEAEQHEHQPVNVAVRLAAATLLAERARAAALAANRRSDYAEAQRLIREIVDDLRAMAPGDRDVLAIIDRLHHDEVAVAEVMSPMAMKSRHFAAYSAVRGRDAEGKARRTTRRS